jgi:hypothetical protein
MMGRGGEEVRGGEEEAGFEFFDSVGAVGNYHPRGRVDGMEISAAGRAERAAGCISRGREIRGRMPRGFWEYCIDRMSEG